MDFKNSGHPLVSILIPAYNHEAYIVKCLDSILADGYPNIEVIIVDDGSSDKTSILASEWANQHGKYFQRVMVVTKKNEGVSKTLNHLVAISNGKYLRPIASDDQLTSGAIIKMVNYLESSQSILAVIGDCRVIDNSGAILHESALENLFHVNKSNYLTQEGLEKEIVQRWAIAGPSMLIRRNAYDYVGGYDESLIVEDQDFYLRLVSLHGLRFLDATVADYRIHESNASNKANIQRRLKILEGRRIAISKNTNRLSPYLRRLALREYSFLGMKASYLKRDAFGFLGELLRFSLSTLLIKFRVLS